MERRGLSVLSPLPSPVFVAECVLYTRGRTVRRRSLRRVETRLKILSSTSTVHDLFLPPFLSLPHSFFLSFLLFSTFPPFSLFLCSSSPLRAWFLAGWDRAPRLENSKRKCFRFVREAGIILSRVYWLAFIPRNFFPRSCKLFPMKIRFTTRSPSLLPLS